MKKIFLFIATLISLTSAAQKDTVDAIVEAPLSIVEQMPAFPGGEAEMMKFIQKSVTFPQAELDKGLSGTAYVTFVVEKDGSITDVKLLRGVPGAPGFDKEAVRVVRSMPNWIPGKQNDKYVRVQFSFPIKFTNHSTVKLTPEQEKAAAYLNKGKELILKEQYSEALKEFEEALKVVPDHQEALFGKGLMLFKMNKNKEACEAWAKIKPDWNTEANKIIQRNCK